MDYKDKNLPIEQRINDLLNRMTLEEKTSQLNMLLTKDYNTKTTHVTKAHTVLADDTEFKFDKIKEIFSNRAFGFTSDGYSSPKVMNKLQKYCVEQTRLGIPCINVAEALHGLCGAKGTIFPVPLNFATTFNIKLIKKVGQAIAKETRSMGMHEILAPNLDVARDPRWGRNEETFGEDTYLASRMAVAIITGAQRDGTLTRDDAVVTEPKHYCVHGIAEGGVNCSPARTGKREIYSCHMPVFECAIKEAGAYNVMASYNSIDGDVVMCSKEYLNDVLKVDWKAKGYVRSDWGGIYKIYNRHFLVNSPKEALKLALKNGLDTQGLDIPIDDFEKYVPELVSEGYLSMDRINDAVSRVLRVKFELGLFENPYTDEEKYRDIIRCDEHKQLAYEVARQSVVLIKNDNNALPLDDTIKSIALIGPNSDSPKIGGYSSTPVGYTISSIYDELKEAIGDEVYIHRINGCAITEGEKKLRFVDGQPHLSDDGVEEIKDEIELAIEMASKCDYIIMVGGDNKITSGELNDRSGLILYGKQRELIEKLSKIGKPLTLIMLNGKAVDLEAENNVCNAIISAGFGGEFGSKAIVDTILGKNNPSGKLAVSYPQSETKIPCYYSMLPGGDAGYLEGSRDALYSFGHGLSYSNFEYQNLKINIVNPENYEVEVSFDILNTSDLDGDEVAQLYIFDVESSVVTPLKLLKAFERVSLKSKQKKTVTIRLNYDSFKIMDINYNWVVEKGNFKIMIGSSSRDIRLEQTIIL